MRTLLALATVALFAAVGQCGEKSLPWPQFRGPAGSGVSESAKPPVNFGPDKNVKWKAKVPSGLSSPIIAGDKIVITALDDGKLYTIAYNRADGKEAWRAEAPCKKLEFYHKTESSPAASSSATDGKRIVSYFGSCGLFCYDLAGNELWKHEMPTAVSLGHFGSGVSPIIAADTVVLVRDTMKDGKIIALDVANGKPRWEKSRLSPLSYGTPVVCESPAGKQLVAPGHGRLIAYDLKTGDEKWFVAGMPAGCCSSPVAAEGLVLFAGWSPGDVADKEFKIPTFDELLKQLDKDGDGALSKAEFQSTPFKDFFDHYDANKDGKITRDEWEMMLKFIAEGKNSAFAVKPGGAGDVTKSHVVWKKTKGLPYIPSGVAYQGQYVMVKDGGIVTALDLKTGKEVWQERLAAGGRYYATPIAANGSLYFTALDDGSVTVLKAGSNAPEVVATNPKLGERVGATPAIAGDTIYIRTAGHLYAFSEKQ